IFIVFIVFSFYIGTTPQTAAATSKITSARAGIILTATLLPQVKLSISEVSLDIRVDDASRNSAIVAVPVTSSWSLNSASKVELVGYFDSPASALADNANHAIPASHVIGGFSQDGMLPFTDTSRIGSSASRTLFQQRISAEN